jgi:UDP-glucose 4-epimerase
LPPNDKLTIQGWELAGYQDPQILDGVDVLCHLAADLPPDYDDPKYAQACLSNNALGTQKLLEAARNFRGIHFIYYSSGNSYALQDRMVHENDPLFPSGHAVYYLSSKLVGEMFCEHNRIAYDQHTTTLRLSSVYGPGQTSGVLFKFLKQLSKGCPIDIWDGGRYVADLVFVEDVIQATVRVIERSACGIYNIGGGQCHSMLDVAKIMAELTHAGSDMLRVLPSEVPTPGGFSGLDITKARTILGYEPTPLRVGLKQFIESANVSLDLS